MKDVAEMAVKLMAAARTAPKAGGKDFLEIVVVTADEDLKRIGTAMREYAPRSTNEAFWLRDASNIENSQALLLVADLCKARHFGTAMGTFGTIFDVGHASGPILAGILIARFDYLTSFLALACLIALAVPVFLAGVPRAAEGEFRRSP